MSTTSPTTTSRATPGQRLDGRVALVTGAPGGLGRAMAAALADAGARVAVHHLGEAEAAAQLVSELRAGGAAAEAFEADVRDWDAVGALVERVERALGPLDVCVNNAGVMDEQPFGETALADWERTIAVNLTGVFVCCRHVVPRMHERGRGAVVNLASQVAFKGVARAAAYCAAKAGVVGLTRALAREYGPAVRVNAVAPGPIETPLVAPFADAAWREARTAGLVAGRLGQPEEVAPAVVFLASDQASFIHGQCLHVNGGGVMA
jgi:3-oxoacyl-[acyl-carrier protein] reductase